MKRLALASTVLLTALAFVPASADARRFGGGGFHGGGLRGGGVGGPRYGYGYGRGSGRRFGYRGPGLLAGAGYCNPYYYDDYYYGYGPYGSCRYYGYYGY